MEEQEDVNSFLEATEERKADLKGTTGVDTMGRGLLEIGTLEAKGSLPPDDLGFVSCLALLVSTEALFVLLSPLDGLLSPVDGLEMDVLCSSEATGCFVAFANPCDLIPGLLRIGLGFIFSSELGSSSVLVVGLGTASVDPKSLRLSGVAASHIKNS
jgi:hypothetical protein